MAKKQLLTQAEYAKKIGKSRQYVNQLVKAGVIQLQNGKIDPDKADLTVRERTSRAKSRKSSEKPEEFYESQAKHEKMKARMKELDVLEREGELIRKVAAEKILFEESRRIRDRVLAINDRMAAFLDPEQAEILAREIQVALQ